VPRTDGGRIESRGLASARSYAAQTTRGHDGTGELVPPAQHQAWLVQQQKMINQANEQVGALRQYLTQSGQL
jgi:hypothetical protein